LPTGIRGRVGVRILKVQIEKVGNISKIETEKDFGNFFPE
jgi:hypothetical protein